MMKREKMTTNEYIKKAQEMIFPLIEQSSKHGDSAAQFLVASFTALMVNKLKEIDELKEKLKDD